MNLSEYALYCRVSLAPLNQRAWHARSRFPGSFRQGHSVENRIDRSRYDVLGEMQRAGLELTQTSTSLLTAIQLRYPSWQLRPAEQAGFHIWHGDAAWIRGDSTRFKNVPDDLLIDEAKKAADGADFLDGDHWQALCQSEPQRALRGLIAKAGIGRWPAWAWNPFLWAGQKLDDTDSVNLIGDLLLKFPMQEFSEVSNTASWWLDEKTKILHENLLWALWDKIEEATRPQLTEEGHSLTDALNAPPGRLAEVLIKRMALGTPGLEIPAVIRDRLDKLASGADNFGRLARVYLAAEVSLLFERARDWTSERVVPLFDWSSAEAPYAWSARKYSNFIGSPQLFDLTKEWFLALLRDQKLARMIWRRLAIGSPLS